MTMKIAISGASGLIGSALKNHFEDEGKIVIPIKRTEESEPLSEAIAWNPEKKWIDGDKLEGLDAVVHLAGESIMGRWSSSKKRKILESRVEGTSTVAEALRRLDSPPKAFFCASGVHYYGDRDGELLREGSSPGDGFLAKVCRKWEESCAPAKEAGSRVVNLRFAAILTPRGGMLGKLLPVFQSGMGGRAGSGKQYVSWISETDLVRVVSFLLENDAVRGPVNVAAPHAVTNADFAQALGSELKRPAKVPTPAIALRLTMGEMADEMILSSIRAYPEKLLAHGFEFKEPELAPALHAMLMEPAEK